MTIGQFPEYIKAPQVIRPEEYEQIGSAGCITACMANAARFLLQQDVTPADVDREVGRDPEVDFTMVARDVWLLQKGLRVVSIEAEDPTHSDEFVEGKISLQEFARYDADENFNGDVDAALAFYSGAEYQHFLQVLREAYVAAKPLLASYKSTGQYKVVKEQPAFSHIESAVAHGGVAFLRTRPNEHMVAHQFLAFPFEKNQETDDPETDQYLVEDSEDCAASLYFPVEDKGNAVIIYGVDASALSDPAFIDFRGISLAFPPKNAV